MESVVQTRSRRVRKDGEQAGVRSVGGAAGALRPAAAPRGLVRSPGAGRSCEAARLPGLAAAGRMRVSRKLLPPGRFGAGLPASPPGACVRGSALAPRVGETRASEPRAGRCLSVPAVPAASHRARHTRALRHVRNETHGFPLGLGVHRH